MKYRMQNFPNFTEFSCGAPLPFGNWQKYSISGGAVAKGKRFPF
jgi:hypothetical protein